jgi:hypothetical protein
MGKLYNEEYPLLKNYFSFSLEHNKCFSMVGHASQNAEIEENLKALVRLFVKVPPY